MFADHYVRKEAYEIGLLQGDGAERLLRANRKQAREFKVL